MNMKTVLLICDQHIKILESAGTGECQFLISLIPKVKIYLKNSYNLHSIELYNNKK